MSQTTFSPWVLLPSTQTLTLVQQPSFISGHPILSKASIKQALPFPPPLVSHKGLCPQDEQEATMSR